MSKKNGKLVKCETCGKELYRKGFRLKTQSKHYCSFKCRTTRKEVKCIECGKSILRPACRIKKHNYCDASCQMKYEYAHGRIKKPSENLYIAHKEKCSGANHYHWTGDKYSWQVRRTQSPEWVKIRNEAYKRDKYTCQICGVKERIHAHHIVPYRVTMDNSLANIICLCVKCHRIEELKYFRSMTNG